MYKLNRKTMRFKLPILIVFLASTSSSIIEVYASSASNHNSEQDNMIGVPPLRLGPCKWLVDNTSMNHITTSSSGRKNNTWGLLQVPCSVLVKTGSNLKPGHTSEYDGDYSSYSHIEDPKSLSAFIDTGAQVTVMPFSTAKRLRLAHHIDRRYAGRATGVGTVKIIGKIPGLTILMELPASSSPTGMKGVVKVKKDVTILGIEERTNPGTKNVDLLIGLDVLKELEACVDLKENCLKVSVPHSDGNDNNRIEDFRKINVKIPFVGADTDIAKQDRQKPIVTKRSDIADRGDTQTHVHASLSSSSSSEHSSLDSRSRDVYNNRPDNIEFNTKTATALEEWVDDDNDQHISSQNCSLEDDIDDYDEYGSEDESHQREDIDFSGI